ncbi:hypothetical protein HII17_07015 [Thalassotalea sp. M1531]|uniref:Uncharacterized protein n=1 Tax=Thalassotalea algicola TaxID=2716224 RepID=A0A7Y0Q6Y4_9GAMM|nr:hypothetical protein [Thalassotalea algicola]NMP31307.1 hypothetical protein [Thalassotalea algicola]
MALLVILLCVFAVVALMVVFGEKFGKPIDVKTQNKYSKWIMILVFASLFIALFKNLLA